MEHIKQCDAYFLQKYAQYTREICESVDTYRDDIVRSRTYCQLNYLTIQSNDKYAIIKKTQYFCKGIYRSVFRRSKYENTHSVTRLTNKHTNNARSCKRNGRAFLHRT